MPQNQSLSFKTLAPIIPLGAQGIEAGVTTIYTSNMIGDPLAFAGNYINEYSVMTIPAVYCAIDFISSQLAAMPKHVYKRLPNPSRLLGPTPEHPLETTLNDEINGLNNPYTFWTTYVSHALDWGNGYAFIDDDNMLYNLPPDSVQPFRYMGQQWYEVSTGGEQYTLPASSILHLPGLGFDGMKGYPIVELMCNALRTGKSAELYGDAFFRNGANGIGSIETEMKLSNEQLSAYQDKINSGHVGIDKAHKWIMLGNGLKAKPFPVNNEQAQFLATRSYSNIDVCRIFRVPPHVIYEMDRQTWNNISAMQSDIVKSSLLKWIVPIEQEIRRKLFSQQEKQQGYYVKFCVDELLRGDASQQIQNTRDRLGCGLTDIDEERALYDMVPRGGGCGVNAIPVNMMAADRLLDAPAATATTAAPTAAPANAASPVDSSSETPQQDDSDGTDAQEQPVEQSKAHLDSFSKLIKAASNRISKKHKKFLIQNFAKHQEGQGDGWIPAVNVFSAEQKKTSASAIAPILTTFAEVSGKVIDVEAHSQKIGEQYATKVKAYLYGKGKNETIAAPILSEIVNNYEGLK